MSKRDYETYIIVDGNLEDIQIEEIISKYDALYKKHEVEVKNLERIGRRKLAYPIKKKQNGYYICFEFVSDASFIAKLDRAYKLDETLLRFLTIYMSPRTLKEKEDHFKRKALVAEKLEAEQKELAEAEAIKSELVIDEIKDADSKEWLFP